MSEENVEAVRAVYEKWREGDFRAAFGYRSVDPP
jgi:hypothetical protein